MRIRYEMLALVALLGVTAAMLRPTQLPVTSADAARQPTALEARSPRDSVAVDAQTRARQREQAIDAARLRLIASGELTAREATPAELRMIRSGALSRLAPTTR